MTVPLFRSGTGDVIGFIRGALSLDLGLEIDELETLPDDLLLALYTEARERVIADTAARTREVAATTPAASDEASAA